MSERRIDRWHRHAYELLCHWRKIGLPDLGGIPTQDWFKARLDPEAYELWNTYNFSSQERLTDEWFYSLGAAERIEIRQREDRRWRDGLWVRVPSFDKLGEKAKDELRQKFPAAGLCQLLTGPHYMLLAYCSIDNNSGDGPATPSYFRRDALLFDQSVAMQNYPLKEGEDREMLATFKCRSSRYTTSTSAIAINNMYVYQGFRHGIATDLQKKMAEQSENIRMLQSTIPTWRRQMAEGKDGEKKDLWRIIKGQGEVRFVSRFINPRTKSLEPWQNSITLGGHKTTDWEGKRLRRLDIDEAGICQYGLEDLVAKGGSCCTNEETRRIGLVTVGGVSNKNSVRNAPYLRSLAADSEQHRTLVFFSGKQHSLYREKNGWTDEERVIKENLARRAEVESQHGALLNYITDNTIYISDSFHVSEASRLNVEQLRAWRTGELRDRLSNPEHPNGHIVIKRGWLRVKPGADTRYPEFHPDAKGGWRFLQFPDQGSLHGKRDGRPDRIYCAGGDSIHKYASAVELKELTEDGGGMSKQAMVIMNLMTKQPVAYYLWRHADPKDDFMQCLYGFLMYNCFYLPESNLQLELHFLHDYEDSFIQKRQIFTRYVRNTPSVLQRAGKVGSSREARFAQKGFHTGSNKIALFDNYVVPYFNSSLREVLFPDIVETFENWNIENKKGTPDLGMAMLGCLICMSDILAGMSSRPAKTIRGIPAAQFYSALGSGTRIAPGSRASMPITPINTPNSK